MPSWSSRFGLASASSGGSRPSQRLSTSRQETQRMLNPQQCDDGMTSQPARHSRSRSFNFLSSADASEPIPVNGKQPSTRRLGKGISDGNLKKSGDGSVRISRSYESSSIKPSENQMASGNCCCCDWRVQWPSHLSVYRCTTCLTINDLVPVPRDEKRGPASPVSTDSLRALLSSVRSEFIQSIKGLGYLASEGPIQATDLLNEKSYSPSLKPQIIVSTEPSGTASEKREDGPTTEEPLPLAVHSTNEGDCTNIDVNAARRKRQREITSNMFSSLDDYIIRSFSRWECLNDSFREGALEDGTKSSRRRASSASRRLSVSNQDSLNKTTIPIRLAEGEYEERLLRRQPVPRKLSVSKEKERPNSTIDTPKTVSLKTPDINWKEMNEFYHLLLTLGDGYADEVMDELEANENFVGKNVSQFVDVEELRLDIEEARAQTLRTLLKATESLLKRPGRPIKSPEDIRFLLIILGNPLLYGAHGSLTRVRRESMAMTKQESKRPMPRRQSSRSEGGSSGNHTSIIKRILGITGFLPNECHHYLVSWFARFPDDRLKSVVELCNSFVTHRLAKQYEKKRDNDSNLSSLSGRKKKREKGVIYDDDWQIKAAAKVMAILFAANNSTSCRRHLDRSIDLQGDHASNMSVALQAKYDARKRGQLIPTSDFYNSMLDYADLIADFEAWEGSLKSLRFCFCQYPFFFSIGSKIHILEYDARRQMELKAREAFFSTLSTKRTVNQYLTLKIRRECLVEDSLKGISEGVGSLDEIKKGLKIEFQGEDGIDAGGLRKEWFLLLVRDVFDPNYGMFTYDEDSGYCYFNPNSLESTEDFFLIGVVLGLAIYNSTILDVALPPFLFKKLLHGANHTTAPSFARTPLVYTLDDLAVFRPRLAAGLKELLEFKGDVQETFCRDFVASTERFGVITEVPLCPDGANKPVTNANRREFVDLYVRYIIDTSVARQFEPFKRGFFTVCAGNALSLFRPEEIELLIRGSAEPLDITSLQAVAVYENWHTKRPEAEPVVQWFWEFFSSITPKEQRMLLSFITGSDRIPATGATNLVIKIACMGQDLNNRFPIARTCFNQLCLWRYKSKEKFTHMIWRAVVESQGFGLR